MKMSEEAILIKCLRSTQIFALHRNDGFLVMQKMMKMRRHRQPAPQQKIEEPHGSARMNDDEIMMKC